VLLDWDVSDKLFEEKNNLPALGGTVLALVSRMSNCRKDGFNGVQSSMNSKQQYDTEGFLCFDF
jgi:hypothetical protein